jgi:hypothetical protein
VPDNLADNRLHSRITYLIFYFLRSADSVDLCTKGRRRSKVGPHNRTCARIPILFGTQPRFRTSVFPLLPHAFSLLYIFLLPSSMLTFFLFSFTRTLEFLPLLLSLLLLPTMRNLLLISFLQSFCFNRQFFNLFNYYLIYAIN